MENNIYEITKLITKLKESKSTVLDYETFEFWTLSEDDLYE